MIFRSGQETFLIDSAQKAPKSVFRIIDDKLITNVKTKRPLANEVIGEVHMKDLTWLVDTKSQPGTYLAAAEFAKQIKDTGVTMVEFLPVNIFSKDFNNYWGYMTLGFHALSNDYAQKDKNGNMNMNPLEQFRVLIDALHQQDIKICMDVAFNHDGEAGQCDNNDQLDVKYYSFTPIDDKGFHKITYDGYYHNDTGCGNEFNATSEFSKDFVADTVAYWAKQGVDAFRFDLGAQLMDTNPNPNPPKIDPHGYNAITALEKKLEQRGIKVNSPFEAGSGISLIAEPWTAVGTNAYQHGSFPQKWSEWSDISRQYIRKITWAPDKVTPNDIRHFIEGQCCTFKEDKLPVNYGYCHDGEAMYDVCLSANVFNPYKVELDMKKQIALPLIARGVAMFQIGDLFSHSKKGNNNSYDQDNEINHINYSEAIKYKKVPKDNLKGRVYQFAKDMIEFRKTHPVLSQRKAGENIKFYNALGGETANDCSGDWHNPNAHFFAFRVFDEKDNIYIAHSKFYKPIPTELPKNSPGKKWYRVCDSADVNDRVFVNGRATAMQNNKFDLAPGSISIFIEK
jgi:pullulanase/glycogen debranching enzyme